MKANNGTHKVNRKRVLRDAIAVIVMIANVASLAWTVLHG